MQVRKLISRLFNKDHDEEEKPLSEAQEDADAALEKLRKKKPDIPVLIITGIAKDFKQFISSRKQVPPPDGYLEKPVKPETLIAEVERLLS